MLQLCVPPMKTIPMYIIVFNGQLAASKWLQRFPLSHPGYLHTWLLLEEFSSNVFLNYYSPRLL